MKRPSLALLLVPALLGCESKPQGPTFAGDIEPIFNRHCVMCHLEGGAQGDFSLHPQPYANMIGVRSTQSDMLLVVPGDVEASYLQHKLLGTHIAAGGEGESMPYERDLLVKAELDLIEQWIEQGAREK